MNTENQKLYLGTIKKYKGDYKSDWSLFRDFKYCIALNNVGELEVTYFAFLKMCSDNLFLPNEEACYKVIEELGSDFIKVVLKEW